MIIPMNEGHVAQIAALERECFSDPWSERSVASELANEYSLWLVAEQEGKVFGYVGSQSVPPEADVMNLAVAPESRKLGLGRALMCELMRRLRESGIDSLSLEVRESNFPALALYTKLGFFQVGKRPRYYVNPAEDALILRKELCDANFSD